MSSPRTSSPIISAQRTSTPTSSMLVNLSLSDSDLVADLPPWYFDDLASYVPDTDEIDRMLNESCLETPFIPAREPVLPGAPARVARALTYDRVDETIPWAEVSIKQEPLTPRLPPFTPIRIPAVSAPRAFDVIEFPLDRAETEDDDDENDNTIFWEDENKENIAPLGCEGCYACTTMFSTSLPDERTLKKMRF
jgi:hypothetical protein